MDKKETPDYGIDELAVQAFEAMGFSHPFPARLVNIYKSMKICRDRLTPGRLTSEGFASCAVIFGMTAPDKEDKKTPKGG